MKIDATYYRRLSTAVGTLLTLMGLGLTGAFVHFLWSGDTPLAAPPLGLGGPGVLIAASIGAFALPLGLSLLSSDSRGSVRLRIAAGALAMMAVIRGLAFTSPELRDVLGAAPLIEFFVLGAVAVFAYFLRPQDESPIELRTEVLLDVPATAAWKVLGEQFGSVGEWASGLRASSLDGDVRVGALRTCDLRAFGPFPSGRIVEQLLEFDRDTMKFSYAPTSGMPPMIDGARNRWSIEPVGAGRCRVRSHASVELRWWALPFAGFLARGIRTGVDTFVEEMRHRIELGRVHPRKVAASA